MRFELKSLTDYSDESILVEMQRVASIVTKPHLTRNDFDHNSKVSSSTVIRRFGGWREALKAAGLSSRHSGKAVTMKQRMQKSRSWSNEKILTELKDVSEKKGSGVITIEDIGKYSKSIGPQVLRSRFGSVKEAINQAGLKISNRAKRYTDDECYENLLKIWTLRGRPPRHQEMNVSPSTVGFTAYIVRWGTWRKALRAFVDRMNLDLPEITSGHSESKQSPLLRNSPIKVSSIKEENQREIRLGLRYRVLRRDNFRCVLCGRSPANCPGLELHVDHIIPFSKGGQTIERNLRTTCSTCNLGKGAKIE